MSEHGTIAGPCLGLLKLYIASSSLLPPVAGGYNVRVVVLQGLFVGLARMRGWRGAFDNVDDYGGEARAREVDFLVVGDVADGAVPEETVSLACRKRGRDLERLEGNCTSHLRNRRGYPP